ncbi:hypothetical protein SAMD00019534_025570 [Acytostelium subglobosum LB1]|uniref:hypothetical protein n=1 Tax=Acytostelium subglobosum LB1 TaxID=1410327 RepID=UPI000644FE28|nr:hypothetical protein SAMD00019534_025570 [Acytostelium subglobosum LB1]GAM19382.1 hypothetical protein SAMD00019534_025570 [Acytostelium subglobosum LB1]|eukprot:XP_012757309.1 hypothetical protein SAMD00019534_025570 [Acytostelium subglobosum LB1]
MNTAITNSLRRFYTTGVGRPTMKMLGQKKGKDGKLFTVPPKTWDESVSSPSEAIVKAERSSNKSFEELQRLSVRRIHKLNI